MIVELDRWEEEPDVYGYMAAVVQRDDDGKVVRLIDLAATPRRDGRVECDVLDGTRLVKRFYTPTLKEGQRMAEIEGRRALIRPA